MFRKGNFINLDLFCLWIMSVELQLYKMKLFLVEFQPPKMESELNAIMSWLTKLEMKMSVWSVENRDKHESWKSSKIGDCRHIHSQSSRLATARGSGTRLSMVSPTKVKACKFFNSMKSSLVLKIKNTWLILIIFET